MYKGKDYGEDVKKAEEEICFFSLIGDKQIGRKHKWQFKEKLGERFYLFRCLNCDALIRKRTEKRLRNDKG